jgi:hypothetical protein
MSKLPRILSLVVLLYLFGAGSSFADTLQVTFTATIDLVPASETVSGSFLWNTQTEAPSSVSLTSSGPYSFLPVEIEADFAPANFVNNCPQGSLIFLDFQDASHTINFQINYGDHAYFDPPLFPGPGGPSQRSLRYRWRRNRKYSRARRRDRGWCGRTGQRNPPG